MGQNLAIVHGRVSDDTKGGWEKKKVMHRHPVSPTGVLLLVFGLVQRQQNDYFNYGLLKVSKIPILIMTCSKAGK